jgi:hypothetical protein
MQARKSKRQAVEEERPVGQIGQRVVQDPVS